ncbi:hypothetical protein [Halorubrum salinum]|uniref:hypothetical protein n=1 Tax=Halorubrum salinum TaxID=767517 RepID=UPI002111D7A0|nr:hypothetical protein [Halorubrum salinum]
MTWIERDGRTVYVDDDGPAPLPNIAHWLKDVEPPRSAVRPLVPLLGLILSQIDEVVGVAVEILDAVFGVLFCYCIGLQVVPRQTIQVPKRGININVPQPSIQMD